MEDRAGRKTKSTDALRKSSNDPRVIVVVGRMFWQERSIVKARTWLEKAVAVNPDLGDAWGWLYKFEEQHGTQETRDKVISRCTIAEPHHGPVWQATLKAPENASKTTEEILKLTASKLE